MLVRKNAFENHKMVQSVFADALNMPFLDRTFELVYNAGVCEHFDGDGRTRIFLEMARVCNEKGHMIVIVANTHSLPDRSIGIGNRDSPNNQCRLTFLISYTV